MKKLIFFTILIFTILAVGFCSFKISYKLGYKAGHNKHLLESNAVSEDEAKIINPQDPNKPTLRVMTINFDNYPPEFLEIAPVHEVIREKYNIKYVDTNPDIIINGYFDKTQIPNDPDIIKIFYTSEVYVGDPKKFLDSFDLVMGFDFIDKTNYIRLPFSYMRNTDKMKHDYNRNITCNPKREHFACFLVSNSGEWLPGKFDGAHARTRLFHKLSLYKKVLSGGKHLNNIGGPAADTIAFLSQCKFTIAYENTLHYPGYITEKPFYAWLSGTVPIYNAHRSVLEDINPKAVLYAGDFATEDEFVDYIIKVDNDDKLYCEIFNQQIINDPSKDYEVIKDQIRKKLNEIFAKKLRK